jgi:tetratricopeptide (TPR) repeat protein
MNKLKIIVICCCFLNSIDCLSQEKTKIVLSQEEQNFVDSHKDSIPIENPYGLISIGYQDIYMGNNLRGNKIMALGLERIKKKDYELLHELSVQNTKNGNYSIAYDYLKEAASLNPDVYGYFGWVMLYYYRDYKRALNYLTIYDSLTPNFSDFPAGENLYMLKGLSYLMQKNYENAILEFSKYIKETSISIGEKWVDVSTFYYIGIAMLNSGNDKAAIKYFNLAIKYNPHFLEAFYERGKCFNRLGKKKKGIKNLQIAKQLFIQGYQKTDVYVEIFYPVYLQDIVKEIAKY